MVEEKEETKGTADPGSDPGKDGKGSGAEPDSKKGASGTPSPGGDEHLPFDKHPKWQKARQAEKALEDLMEANDLDSLDDLVKLVSSGKALAGRKVTEEQLESLIKKAETLERYEAYWKDQEEKNKRQAEDPDQTIARLEKQLREKDEGHRQKEIQEKKSHEAKQLWENYDREVTKVFDSMDDIPAEARKFYTLFMGVNNPASNVDFTNKKAIREAAGEARKIVDSLMDFAVKQYIGGKKKIPNIPGASSAASEPKPIKNLKEARLAMMDQASNLSKG